MTPSRTPSHTGQFLWAVLGGAAIAGLVCQVLLQSGLVS